MLKAGILLRSGLVFLWMPVILMACAGRSIPTQPPQPPDEYLSNALDWIETHSVKINTVDWPAVRRQALALAPNPQTIADTYPALLFATEQVGDAATWFAPLDEWQGEGGFAGFDAYYPESIIIKVDRGGPAEKAGLQIGDVILSINNAPPRRWQGTPFLEMYDTDVLEITVRRKGQEQLVKVTLRKTKPSSHQAIPEGRTIHTALGGIGYIELPAASGEEQLYPTLSQRIIRESDQQGACGWIVDLRRNSSGDIWYYIAAIGPILGDGDIGGFAYLDGTRETWTYKVGKVFWADHERVESQVEGTVYQLQHPMPPVAVLTSRATMAAGELAVVTFKGRPKVRVFGEPTGGSPFLVFHTYLSDGAFLGVSGADAIDRRGNVYDGQITPDEVISTDWHVFGSDHDPVILAARDWLLNQPECAHK